MNDRTASAIMTSSSVSPAWPRLRDPRAAATHRLSAIPHLSATPHRPLRAGGTPRPVLPPEPPEPPEPPPAPPAPGTSVPNPLSTLSMLLGSVRYMAHHHLLILACDLPLGRNSYFADRDLENLAEHLEILGDEPGALVAAAAQAAGETGHHVDQRTAARARFLCRPRRPSWPGLQRSERRKLDFFDLGFPGDVFPTLFGKIAVRGLIENPEKPSFMSSASTSYILARKRSTTTPRMVASWVARIFEAVSAKRPVSAIATRARASMTSTSVNPL